MLTRSTPVPWRQEYALHRRRKRLDALGEVQVWYDMEHPDAVVEAGSENGVCWQEIQSWQEDGRISSGGRLERQGERGQWAMQGALFGPLEVALFDRVVIRERIYEIRRIQQWPGHRMIQLKTL